MPNTKNYIEQGGERTVIGGEIDIVLEGLKIASVAVEKTAAEINALPIVEQAAEADTNEAIVEADIDTDPELVIVLNIIAAKINLILAKLRLANIIAE